MGDSYKYVPEGVSVTISGLKEVIDDYRERIAELTSLISEISSSGSWKDVQVKNSFLSTANSYIALYKTVLSNMEKYVNYLTKKAESASALEDAFSRG